MDMKLSEWAAQRYTPRSRPCDKTLRSRAKAGKIPGAYKGEDGHWWVRSGTATIELARKQIIARDPKLAEMFG